jgi:hypothetical protein
MAKSKRSIKECVAALTEAPLSSPEEYYALTLLGSAEGRISWSCHSLWVGFENDDPRREIRKARLLDAESAEKFGSAWKTIGESYMVLRTTKDLLVYLLAGGNALIEKELAETRIEISDMLRPQVCVRTGPVGFVIASNLPRGTFNHAPSPKLRMKILKRDDYRCRVCGRRSADHVDVELHVHHIRPWANGGVTVEENLITLCHTCHKGLEPHEEWNLFEMKGGPLKEAPEYRDAVRNYRLRAIELAREGRGEKGATGGTSRKGIRSTT